MPVLQKVYKKAKNIAKISVFEWYSVVLHTMSMQKIAEPDCSMSIWNPAFGDEVLRGTLEGLAARMAAERGCSTVVLNDARACLDRIDQLLAQDSLNDEAFSAYVAENEQFHNLLAEMTDSDVVRRELERVIGLPFASPSGFVIAQANSPQARDMLIIAQDQHRQVLSAIENREGSRAEAIMREHSRLAQRNLSQAMRSPELQGLSTVRLSRRKR